jgi:Txe/YoeB family toxin of Txe-Axe toxin-antitoxin module/preprotein translocase subunit SecE
MEKYNLGDSLVRLDEVTSELEENSQNFKKILEIVDEVRTTAIKVKETSDFLLDMVEDVNSINERGALLQVSIGSTHEILIEQFHKIHESHEQFKSSVNTLILEIKNQDYEMNKHLQTTIDSKLDLIKSDITIDNRRGLEDLNSKFTQEFTNTKVSFLDNIEKTKSEIIGKNHQSSMESQTAILDFLKNSIEENRKTFNKRSILFSVLLILIAVLVLILLVFSIR